MPFTFAHPAAVLPLLGRRRRRLSATALVLGSMAPDFEFYLRAYADGIYGHTWAGLFWLDLPLVLALGGVFHRRMRRPLLRHLPVWLGERLHGLEGAGPWPRQSWGWVGVSALLGSLTHLVWDDLTHFDGRLVVRWAPLRAVVAGYPLYDWLQYGGSVAGLGLLVAFVAWLPRVPQHPVAVAPARRRFWLQAAVLAAGFTALLLLLVKPWPPDWATLLVKLIDGSALGLFFACQLNPAASPIGPE